MDKSKMDELEEESNSSSSSDDNDNANDNANDNENLKEERVRLKETSEEKSCEDQDHGQEREAVREGEGEEGEGEEEGESDPAWMRYMPRTRLTINKPNVEVQMERGSNCATRMKHVNIPSSNKFGPTSIQAKQESKAVKRKMDDGDEEENNATDLELKSSETSTDTTHRRIRRRTNPNISEVSALFSFSKLNSTGS